MLRAAFVIDYQNVHLTARDVFDPNGGPHDSLIHPMQFARRAVQARNSAQRPGFEHAEVTRVTVFRGLPHVDHDWKQHRRCQDQAIQWRRDGAVVELRDLKYQYQYDAGGRPIMDINGNKVPRGKPTEKGIDVLCAIAAINASEDPTSTLSSSRPGTPTSCPSWTSSTTGAAATASGTPGSRPHAGSTATPAAPADGRAARSCRPSPAGSGIRTSTAAATTPLATGTNTGRADLADNSAPSRATTSSRA